MTSSSHPNPPGPEDEENAEAKRDLITSIVAALIIFVALMALILVPDLLGW